MLTPKVRKKFSSFFIILINIRRAGGKNADASKNNHTSQKVLGLTVISAFSETNSNEESSFYILKSMQKQVEFPKSSTKENKELEF